jgi:glycosyltransferase involved in cell wall biosynthesis
LEKNGGAGKARNIGIKNAVGQYISFQDSDDILYPYKLEKQLNNIINKNSNLDFCKIKVIQNSSYNFLIPNQFQENSVLKGYIFDELLSRGNFISTQAILVRKKFIQKYLFDPEMPRLQDYDVILRMIPKVKISYTNDVLVELHLQNDSLTRSPIKLKQAIYRLLKKQYRFNSHQKQSFKNYLNYLLKRYFNNT